MDVRVVAKLLSINSSTILDKAQELCRLLNTKSAPGLLGQGEVCKTAVCLELACHLLGDGPIPPRADFIKRSCANAKVYQETFNRVQKTLDVERRLSPRELSASFGCSLEQQTQELITEYCNKYRSTQPPPQQAATASFLSRPSITAGAFYLTAKKHKAGVDKSVLLVKTGLTRKELDNIIASIFKLCEGSLIPAKGKGKGMAREAAAGQGTKAGVSGGSQQQESGDAAGAPTSAAGPGPSSRSSQQGAGAGSPASTGNARAGAGAAVPSNSSGGGPLFGQALSGRSHSQSKSGVSGTSSTDWASVMALRPARRKRLRIDSDSDSDGEKGNAQHADVDTDVEEQEGPQQQRKKKAGHEDNKENAVGTSDQVPAIVAKAGRKAAGKGWAAGAAGAAGVAAEAADPRVSSQEGSGRSRSAGRGKAAVGVDQLLLQGKRTVELGHNGQAVVGRGSDAVGLGGGSEGGDGEVASKSRRCGSASTRAGKRAKA